MNIKSISRSSVSIHIAIISLVWGIINSLVMIIRLLTLIIMGQQQFTLEYLILAILTPLIYFVSAYIFTFISASAYNLLSKRTGGIRLNTTNQ